ncbi:MAG TPA: glycine--tRNA ligase subunit beta [Vicinamibacterales bacterium]|nr:glycine--tRNA ligase subunit beta [Vicinamibacterales bacterium]
MDRELLLEIGVEELPASWLPGLTEQLTTVLKNELDAEGLPPRNPIEAHATPRRLVVCAPELIDRQEDREETVMGPPVSASFDAEGHPTNAGLGFARKLGVDFDALIQQDTPKGKYMAYHRHTRGRATVDVLPTVVARVLRGLTFPKLMHWDAQLEDDKGEFLFGRPVRWLLLLYGGRVVPFTISRLALASSPRVQDVSSGAVTYGHRFLATSGRAGRAIKVRSFAEYQKKLAENFVILSRIERRDRIMRDLEAQARRIGGRAVLQQERAQTLFDEVPDLVEYPAVVPGAFSAEFLTLPEEVLTTTLMHHQHFFPVANPTGGLMPAFLAVTNTQSTNDRAIATNAERVVTARLRDARFFWDADRQIGLEARLPRLETLLFHKQLGSYGAKATRLEALASWIAADVFQQPEAAAPAGRAAKLAKADLATDMVREFTELQGVMGGIYAREAGEPETVWKAIYHHYLPVAVEANAAPSGEALGQARLSWASVSLADKLDTLVGLFLAGERPTGSRDPFGMRRAAHGILRLLVDLAPLTGVKVRPSLPALLTRAYAGYDKTPGDEWADLTRFLWEREEHVLVARGADKRNVRSVLWQREHALDLPIADVAGNVQALAEFSRSEQFRQLATAFKRVRNIAREFDSGTVPELTDLRAVLKEAAEAALLEDIARRRVAIDQAGGRGDYRTAYAEAAQFEPAVAKFFNDVFVMTDDATVRQARLGLMKQLEQLILQLGDISEIVASES